MIIIIVSNLHVTWSKVLCLITRTSCTLTVASSLACLEIRSRNEEMINTTRNRIYSLKVSTYNCIDVECFSGYLLFICFWIDLVHYNSDNRKCVCGRMLYVCINPWKFKGLDFREITSLPEIKKWFYMARHFNRRQK